MLQDHLEGNMDTFGIREGYFERKVEFLTDIFSFIYLIYCLFIKFNTEIGLYLSQINDIIHTVSQNTAFLKCTSIIGSFNYLIFSNH